VPLEDPPDRVARLGARLGLDPPSPCDGPEQPQMPIAHDVLSDAALAPAPFALDPARR
jgi:hypothetical protein